MHQWGRALCTRQHRCALSMSPALHVTSSFCRSEALWGEWCAPKDTLLLFRVSYICVVRITSDPGDNENIFIRVVFRCAKSSYKAPLNSSKHSRVSEKVSTKSAGRSPDWLFAPALQSEECDTPSAITVSPLWKVESQECWAYTPAGCHSEQNPQSCLDRSTVWFCNLTKSKQPAGTNLQTSPPPQSPPWISTMQNNHLPQPHINIHMKVWRSLNRSVISLNIDLWKAMNKHIVWAACCCRITGKCSLGISGCEWLTW